MRTAMIFLLVVGAVLGTMESMPGQASDRAGAATVPALGRLPLYFVENRGVYSDEVRYYITGADKTLFFTDHGVTIALKGKERGWTVKLDFVGANRSVHPEGLDKQDAVFSYFTGAEKDWKAGLPTYAKLVYRDLWPGIDLVYKGTVNQLKYEFRVAPGADPSLIRLQYRGVEKLERTDAGALKVTTPEGSFEDAPPVAWQEIGGRRVSVAMAYAVDEDGAFAFEVGDYDRTKPLVLDPAVIVYCGYIGGSQRESAWAIAVDRAGCVYLTGNTASDQKTFPVTAGPSLAFVGTGTTADAWVAKLDPTGRQLLYCGYIGGVGRDSGHAIAIDASGCAYVTGSTSSDEMSFPVRIGPDLTHNGNADAFVAKVNAAGTVLVYCGYVGGSGSEDARGLAVDSAGCAYLAGWTNSSPATFPVRIGPDLTYNGGSDDAFVGKVNTNGTGLDYCGYIGGAGNDMMGGDKVPIAVDAAGNAYVAGWTDSDEKTFPVKVGPDLTYNGGHDDVFVAKVNAKGTGLDYCGYIGGASNDNGSQAGFGIALDSAGCAYVTAATASDETSFPVKVGPDLTHNGFGYDVFVAKVDASGTTLVYCGFIGGSQYETSEGIAVDPAGNAYVVGYTFSNEASFPVRRGPDLTFNSSGVHADAFVAKIDAQGSALIFCGYIGGVKSDHGYGIAVDPVGNVYVAGMSLSDQTTFPVRNGPDLTHNGGPSTNARDAFVAKIALQDDLTTSGTPRPGAVVTLNLAAIEARGLPYQMGTSLGPGPIKVGTRKIGLSVDGLLEISVGGKWPHVFQGYSGMPDSQGKATAKIVVPNMAALVGQKLYSAFVTLDSSWPSGIRSISETRVITIVK